MMWNEFMELAGYEVSYETYSKVIEPMYMALPENITKSEFVKMLDKKAFALPTKRQLINEMRKIAKHIAETCGHYTDWEARHELERKAHEYAERFYHLNWSSDIEAFCFFNTEYEYPEIGRGCTFPVELVIGRGYTEYERVRLVK